MSIVRKFSLLITVVISSVESWGQAARSPFTTYGIENDEELGKSWRAALGGEFTPDPFAIGSFVKRITYSTSASIEQYPFLANGNTVKDLGINLAFRFPPDAAALFRQPSFIFK